MGNRRYSGLWICGPALKKTNLAAEFTMLLTSKVLYTSEPRNALDGAALRAVASATPAMFGEVLIYASVVDLIRYHHPHHHHHHHHHGDNDRYKCH